jgi:PIN domain nuclease of toxin-antitoxin system
MSAVVSDTYSLLWYLNDSSKLSTDALVAFEETEQNGLPIYVPAIILVEVRYLVEKGRDIFESDFQLIIGELNSSSSALTFAPLNQSIAENLEKVSRAIVPDMPDRLIAATAFSLNLPLISKDGKIRKLTNVNVIW